MPDVNERALDGRVAVVTGAARNIGRAIALALSEAGAGIVVNALQDTEAAIAVAEDITASGGRAIPLIGDVTDEGCANSLAEAAIDTFGRIDILVSNAAIRRQQPFLEISLEDWHRVLAVPLDGAFLCAKACVPHMIEAGGGSIVTLGGTSAFVGTLNRVHVATAKAGLIGMTHALAVELAPHGIRVNCVAPGAIDTVRGASAGPRPPSSTMDKVPAGRLGRPQEIAGMVRHLCLPDGAYITGQTIHVNGGAFLT